MPSSKAWDWEIIIYKIKGPECKGLKVSLELQLLFKIRKCFLKVNICN